MSKKTLHFIINPISGTGNNKDILKKINKEIHSRKLVQENKMRNHDHIQLDSYLRPRLLL